MDKAYSKAPLPFTGQKRNFLKHFRQIVNDNIANNGEGWTVLDVFGGSGLLSHTVKQIKPKARVIYNDFDDYADRLKHIDDTNQLRRLLENALAGVARKHKLDDATKQKVISILQGFKGYKDVQCIASWLLFSGKQVATLDELCNQTMYHRVRLSDFASATNYLKGLEITKLSFEKLIPLHTKPNTLLILDPPYVCTAQGAYANDVYFGMAQFLKLMALVKPPYIFFSSTRSELLAYMDYLQQYDAHAWQRLGEFTKISVKTHLNKTAKYEDNLIYRF